jgi:uncharacterized membrane protein
MEKNGIIVALVFLYLMYIYPAVGMFKYRKEPWPQQHKFLWVLVGIGLFQLLAVMSVILIMALCGHELHWAVLTGMVFVSCVLMDISYIPFYKVVETYRIKKQLKENDESDQNNKKGDGTVKIPEEYLRWQRMENKKFIQLRSKTKRNL